MIHGKYQFYTEVCVKESQWKIALGLFLWGRNQGRLSDRKNVKSTQAVTKSVESYIKETPISCTFAVNDYNNLKQKEH